MTDRELLEMAAKPIGGFLVWHTSKQTGITKYFLRDGGIQKPWNPLEHDGDALRLAVKLKLDVAFGNRYYFDEGPMTFCGTYWSSGESSTMQRFVKHESDAMSATRRAIVRAAAEIGKAMK